MFELDLKIFKNLVVENDIPVVLVDIGSLVNHPNVKYRQESEEYIQHLAKDIEQNAILDPIMVINKGGLNQVVRGYSRWQAAKLLNLDKVPIVETNEEHFELNTVLQNMTRPKEIEVSDITSFIESQIKENKLDKDIEDIFNRFKKCDCTDEEWLKVIALKMVIKSFKERYSEKCKEAFISVINGSTLSAVGKQMELSRERVRQLCFSPISVIIEYCIKKDIPVPKGKTMNDWKKNKDFWLKHLDISWGDNSNHSLSKNRKGISLIDTERMNLLNVIHEGSGFIDVYLYNYVWQRKK